MSKINIDALVKELSDERERQLMFIESTKKEISHMDEHPERDFSRRRQIMERRLNDKLEKVQKLTEAIKLIETL